MKNNRNQKPETGHASGFTLIELLVVIAIIGVLAAFTIPVLKKVKEGQYKKVARAEMERIETELDSYKAKYGVYPPSNENNNGNYVSSGNDRSQFSQLYYELSGVTRDPNTGDFTTLDGMTTIKAGEYKLAYGVDGVINVSSGNGEDAHVAQNFLPGLKPSQYNSYVTNGPSKIR
ncbi:MAG TPA: type II secretion system protein, partial [Candidatus Binatia bacterium]|nr:type II secretion system protein [Candidatus Binatia bacterium]